MERAGAHLFAGHDDCARCHGTHGRSTASRAVCLSCHQNEEDHHPETKVCTVCHLFE
jgi:hypothetical protein